MTVGERIRSLRHNAGLSQEEFARVLNVTQSTLSRAELDEGEGGPKAAFLVALSGFTQKSIDWIMFGEEEFTERYGMQPYSGATQGDRHRIPLFLVPAPAGMASPAHDHVEQMIDVGELALDDGVKAFACRVVGDSMRDGGIESGDVVIVDRGREPKPGDVIVSTIDGELTIKRFEREGSRVILYPENSRYAPMEIKEGMSLHVWGVAIRLVRGLSNSQLPVP